ncbi:DUF167 domain-containing protein [Tundrisphaera lichenicola]|uniref:DUF167 domain-containing protein n=1 Tax=Tundrisphaera lichenicola TaxID=2029860 RepID=UPI003EBF52AC
MIDLTAHDRGTVLAIRAQPNARKNGVLGERAGALRVGVTVAPEKGKANAAIAEILAEVLGCRNSEVVLLSGDTSRDKRFLILGLDPETLRGRLSPLIPGP